MPGEFGEDFQFNRTQERLAMPKRPNPTCKNMSGVGWPAAGGLQS